MKIIPNTETVRHLCHFHGGNKYYLLAGNQSTRPILVTDVKNLELLSSELKSWCGMNIDVYDTKSLDDKAINTIKSGVPLHLAAENMNLTEV